MDASGPQPELTDGVVTLRHVSDQDRLHRFAVLNGDVEVGAVTLTLPSDSVGRLAWELGTSATGNGYATRAVKLVVDYAFRAIGVARVEAYVDPANEPAMRVATRSGLLREGLLRGHSLIADLRSDRVLLARLATDPPTSDPESFRALLNSFLPRKRAISQMLVRDPDNRVLLCRLTYKKDWDLPGGVVEVHESPQLAVSREVEEELALDIKPGALLLTDWLPTWSGWDDALCLVFDGGVHAASLLDNIVKQAREIRDARFCTIEEVRDLCADFTARRIESALAHVGSPGAYTESGRPL